MENSEFRQLLARGLAIPAHPLALTARRKLDERRQRALSRYYIAAGAGGLAVGVHTTQFEIRDPRVGLFEPVLTLAAEEMSRARRPLVRVAGLCGTTRQAVEEALLARGRGYHAGLLSLAAMKTAGISELISHCRPVADVIPVIGFYLQLAVGGCRLPYAFWRQFAEIENVVAIKIAPFNRYQTLDVIRAVVQAGRKDIALYTGNDDNIVMDLLTPYHFSNGEHRIVGGLLGHWAVWTRQAVHLLEECHRVVRSGKGIPNRLLRRNVEITDCNAAFFDAANGFGGCIAGIHEVLRRQGLLRGIWCLNPKTTLGPGQKAEIDRVYRAYPHLNDDRFVAANLDAWMK